MIPEKYIIAYQEFEKIELELASQWSGVEYAKRLAPYYETMVSHISTFPEEYILFADCGLPHYEMEFAEAVEPIRDELFRLAKENEIPENILFIPMVKIDDGTWHKIINIRVVKIIRQLFDETPGEDFETLRLYKGFHRRDRIHKWLNSQAGTNVVQEIIRSSGVKYKDLIKKRLNIFDKEFARQQMMWMSKFTWIHVELASAYRDWESNHLH